MTLYRLILFIIRRIFVIIQGVSTSLDCEGQSAQGGSGVCLVPSLTQSLRCSSPDITVENGQKRLFYSLKCSFEKYQWIVQTGFASQINLPSSLLERQICCFWYTPGVAIFVRWTPMSTSSIEPTRSCRSCALRQFHTASMSHWFNQANHSMSVSVVLIGPSGNRKPIGRCEQLPHRC
jgi:hypothetical protein